VFCLPVGLVLVALFYALRSPVVRLLPAPSRQVFLPLCQRPLGSPWVVIISLLIGTWTHILWDSFTHREGWSAQHLPVLQSVVFSVGYRSARVCHLLWYACSFAGIMWVYLAFAKWKQTRLNGGAGVSRLARLRDAVLVGLLVLPLELAHHLHHLIRRHQPGLYLVAALCFLPVIGLVLKTGNARPGAAGTNLPPKDQAPISG
jgi:hypothetical protein